MSMRGPYLCIECQLGRCIKVATRCDECAGRVAASPPRKVEKKGVTGTTADPKTCLMVYVGSITGINYDMQKLSKGAEMLATELSCFAAFADYDISQRRVMEAAHAILCRIASTGKLT